MPDQGSPDVANAELDRKRVIDGDRMVRTKESLSSTAKLAVFKLIVVASKTWRSLNGEKQLPKVVETVRSKTESRSSADQFVTQMLGLSETSRSLFLYRAKIGRNESRIT